jgi:homoserine kinase
MNPAQVTIRVPATSANLGAGFDCLALALNLWNTTTFKLSPGKFYLNITGEGAGRLPLDETNLIIRAFLEVIRETGATSIPGAEIRCENFIPLGSGLGSSAAAVLTGILGANAMLGGPLNEPDILRLAARMEGHPDNVAAGLLGGLILSGVDETGKLLVKKVESSAWQAIFVLPKVSLSTMQARQALPENVARADAVFNLGHALLTVEALRTGDSDLLFSALEDRLHQPYRLKLIPGAEKAIQAARSLGAPAALSGAGPGVIAFPRQNPRRVQQAVVDAFTKSGLSSRTWNLAVSLFGAVIETL